MNASLMVPIQSKLSYADMIIHFVLNQLKTYHDIERCHLTIINGPHCLSDFIVVVLPWSGNCIGEFKVLQQQANVMFFFLSTLQALCWCNADTEMLLPVLLMMLTRLDSKSCFPFCFPTLRIGSCSCPH